MELIETLMKVAEAKDLERQGWVDEGIEDPESVADHSFQTVNLVLLLSDGLDADENKMLKMALIHDYPEVIVGDLTPDSGVEKEEKERREDEAFEELVSGLPEGKEEELLGLWKEYLAQESREARLVHEFDRLEMAFQALVYEKRTGKDLQEFFDCAEREIGNERLKGVLEELKNRRDKK